MQIIPVTARLHGEVLSELPPDLYIPPEALEVYLEAFEGPLDLLLYLIRKHNLDILDIPMAELTRQYMVYVEAMRQVNLELAADYLLMSAMLIEIKARMLMPKPTHLAVEEDPRAELVRRLLEYEAMKEAALRLDEMPQVGREVSVAQVICEVLPQVQLPPLDLELLLQAWADLMRRASHFAHHRISREQLSVREHMGLILRRLQHQKLVSFENLFEAGEGIQKLVVYFLALLELVRERLVRITQTEAYAPIYIKLMAE